MYYGTKIIAEERRNKTNDNLIDAVYYHYGFDGITGFEHRQGGAASGEVYYYGKNVQGDITHIYTKAGERIAEYIYDAWGNHSVSAVVGYESLAERNAFRYRGYYYDVSTKLYYLNTRYYDAAIGRFVSADAMSELDPETINGLNLYSYCANNPVMLTDSEYADRNYRGYKRYCEITYICRKRSSQDKNTKRGLLRRRNYNNTTA